MSTARKRQVVGWFHKYLANPVMRRLAPVIPGQAVLETTGRRSGLPRRTPVGGRVEGTGFWLVAGDGRDAQYVRNIEANPRVRLQLRGRWRPGTAVPLPDDDPRLRLRRLPRTNGLLVRALGTNLLTIRIDFD
ncbi:nitroreductase/quinone reductase family protein [Amycolatopsis anabasis]|uniref:nitroreductase/quinone reductase family protein n=1 Tax=Amycolatopsis anabasis TaxID=1840409 RepID=UPI00131A6BCF|nr:nitroreductase/quinone reductase family protein [Amycolatopsis anabasis]